jgi:hypothetical protein
MTDPIPRRPSTASTVAWALVALAGLGLVGYLATLYGARNAAKSAMEGAAGIAARFKTGTITTTFTERLPEVRATRGDILEVATYRGQEELRREDSLNTFWDMVPLGTTVSVIRVPATFRFHIRLSDPWRLAARDHVCIVRAPAIRPSQPPAIHTDAMEKSTESGWARFNKADNLEILERSLTPELERRASALARQALVREACRTAVAEFVKTWLLKEDHWRRDRFSTVIVLFPDEARDDSDEALRATAAKPALRLP